MQANTRQDMWYYGNFLQDIKDSGYLTDGEIVDLMKSSMTDGDRARLNGYRLDDMQYRIFLDASSDITDEDRKKMLETMQEITNYKLKLSEKHCDSINGKKCGYEVVIEKDEKGNPMKVVVERNKDKTVKRNSNNEIILRALKENEKEYEKSNKLINKLLEKGHEVFITNEVDNKRTNGEKWLFYDNSAATRYNVSDKVFYIIKVNQIEANGNYEWNPEMKWGEKPPLEERTNGVKNFITMAHEMIHVYHYIMGTNSGSETAISYIRALKNSVNPGVVKDVWIDKNGNITQIQNLLFDEPVTGKLEEYRTVGIGNETIEAAKKNEVGDTGFWNKDFPDDITENMIRREHGFRYRAAYRE